ncbi:rab-GAP TBC domain-containing protein [Favolaschia claudopus]|uniref:Rab-GAP TBC domain-containing protein n=1 Tax=Favolaschia claudopus TaxID=2862362 RepID=A0AAW0APR0_9AGAR
MPTDRLSSVSDDSDSFDGGTINTKRPSRARKTKSSGACVHCKSLKVRCEFSLGETVCQRCRDGNHECLARNRKKRKPAPTHEDLQEKAQEQDRQIENILAQMDRLRTKSKMQQLIGEGRDDGHISPRPSAPPIVKYCCLYPAEIIDLFAIYFERPYFSILDSELHRDPADVIWDSPFLFTVICATAARFYTLRPNLYHQAHAFAREAAARALIDASIGVDVCQAYLILAVYPMPKQKRSKFADDRSWLFMGVAIRMAMELGLDQPPPPHCDERESLNRMRTWLNCFCVDASHAIQFGKMPMLKLDDFIARTSRDWYRSSALNGPFDVHLCAYVHIILLMAEWRRSVHANVKMDSVTLAIQAQEELTHELADWVARFDQDNARHPLPICVYRGNTTRMITAYLRLVVLADGFQRITREDLSRDSDILRLSIDAARAVIHIALNRLYPTGHLRFAMEANWLYISFASAFLQDIVLLVSELIKVLRSDNVALDGRHTPALYARFLSSLLEKYNVFPSRDDSPPTDDPKFYPQFGLDRTETPPYTYSWPDITNVDGVSPHPSDGSDDFSVHQRAGDPGMDLSLNNFIRAVNEGQHHSEFSSWNSSTTAPGLRRSRSSLFCCSLSILVLNVSGRQAYAKLFSSATSSSRIRDAALADRLFTSDTLEIPGRSLAWKLFLLPDEPLQPLADSVATPPLSSLRVARKKWKQLLSEHMRAPDGSYEEGVVPDSLLASERRASAGDLETNNPLSLHKENPWKEWFASVELRKTILQDVERTFPEIAFFREPEVQVQLTNILFIYSTVTNPATGYRQGMHELLAPLYYAVDYDSVDDADEQVNEPALQEACSRTGVAADAWALFEAVMRGASKWYEWQESAAASRPPPSSPFATHVNIPAGPVEIKPYITPVVEDCNRIQSVLLRSVDPLLWKHMQAVGIEPQIYGIRWLRLLFTREFEMSSAMKLWDGLFACDPTFELAPWICTAMLIRIRNELIPSDYSGQLTSLLRYPSQPSGDGPHHTSVLLRQALALQMSPSEATGHSLVLENRNRLNIPTEVPSPPPPPQRRAPRSGREKVSATSAKPSDTRAQPGQQMGLETFARGLLEKSESFGINKTIMSAVPELRRNLSELAASFVRSPTTPSFPMEDERLPEERPPWEPKSRLEMERELALLKSNNKRLGESLSWAVDLLLQDETEVKDRPQLQKSKGEAVEAISYVRDVLTANLLRIEEDRLFGEEELAKRRGAHHKTSSSGSSIIPVAQPKAPTPVTVVESLRSRVSADTPPPLLNSFSSPPTSPTAARSPTSPSIAPWHYTRSNFVASNLPSASLPRVPPPTSSTIRRPPEASLSREPRASRPAPPRRAQSSTEHDPLGVL